MSGRILWGCILSVVFLTIWITLVVLAVGRLIGRPLSKKWIKVTAELKPLSDAEDLQVQALNRMAEIYAQQTHANIAPPAADVHSAVYTVDGALEQTGSRSRPCDRVRGAAVLSADCPAAVMKGACR